MELVGDFPEWPFVSLQRHPLLLEWHFEQVRELGRTLPHGSRKNETDLAPPLQPPQESLYPEMDERCHWVLVLLYKAQFRRSARLAGAVVTGWSLEHVVESEAAEVRSRRRPPIVLLPSVRQLEPSQSPARAAVPRGGSKPTPYVPNEIGGEPMWRDALALVARGARPQLGRSE